MLSLSRKVDYALIALTDLAAQPDATVSARHLAEKYRMPVAMLTNILKELSASGIVISTRGSKGGYRLANAAEAISFTRIIECLDHSPRLTPCCEAEGDTGQDVCDLESHCPTKVPIRKVHRMLREFLDQVTLADIASDCVQISVSVPVKEVLPS